MAAEPQFASLDGTAFHGEGNEFQPNPNTIARRSISIFSRRGTETPEPKPPFIAQAAMQVPRKLSEKQRRWIKRKSCPASNTPPQPKVTILNAVPPAKTIRMTPLEEEMASSPNEEILSAVSGSPVRLPSPREQMENLWSKSTTSIPQQSKSQRRRDTISRIGIWQNGVAHFDDQAIIDWGAGEPILPAETVFVPWDSAEGLSTSQSSRPQLSVVIPGNKTVVDDSGVTTIVEPMPRRSIVSVAPASIVSRFALSTPAITLDEPHDLVPLESAALFSHPPSPPSRPSPKAPVQRQADEEVASNEQRPETSRSSSSGSLAERDDTSELSHRSSATSIDAVTANTTPEKVKKALDVASLNKPLPPRPISLMLHTAPAPPPSPTSIKSKRVSAIERSISVRSALDDRRPRLSIPQKPLRASRSLSQLDVIDLEFMRSAPAGIDSEDVGSPTLSQAADELEAHLSKIAETDSQEDEDNVDAQSILANSGSVRRSGSVRSVMQPPERTPTLPKRSRKREWRASLNAKRSVQMPNNVKTLKTRKSESSLKRSSTDSAGSLRKSSSAAELRVASLSTNVPPVPGVPRIIIDDGLIVLHGPQTMHDDIEQEISGSSGSAEEVLLNILSALTNAEDLFNTALINKGMYRVYKENEMHLIRTVAYNQSPAAWEFREWCPPEQSNELASDKASSQLEHTPKSYLRCQRRDVDTIESLKALILEHCQTAIRRETALALSTPDHPNAQRFNDAFWRIWCFCKIFGCGKRREEDVTGQLDWLKGGLLANNQDLTATMNMNLDFDMASVLLNPPEHFAKGNNGGLSAQQLYDMTEIWTCLTALLQGYQGRTDQARRSGVFNGCEIFDGDEEAEETALEEWTSYLLTLGPDVVLEMAQHANDESSAGFALAKVNGWTQWTATELSDSRSSFLKEPVARLYEERVAAAAVKFQNPREQEKKELSRKRVASLAAEIKLARQSSAYRRLPLIDQNMERSMSMVSRRNSTASTVSMRSPPPVSRQSSVNYRRTSAPVQVEQKASFSQPPFPSQPSIGHRRTSTPAHIGRAPNFSFPRPRSPPSTLRGSPRKISPIIEERVDSFNRMSLQNFGTGVAEATSDRAIKRIVDMGFSAAEAVEALRLTDMGDGLRVDRAVDLLLRQHQ